MSGTLVFKLAALTVFSSLVYLYLGFTAVYILDYVCIYGLRYVGTSAYMSEKKGSLMAQYIY